MRTSSVCCWFVALFAWIYYYQHNVLSTHVLPWAVFISSSVDWVDVRIRRKENYLKNDQSPIVLQRHIAKRKKHTIQHYPTYIISYSYTLHSSFVSKRLAASRSRNSIAELSGKSFTNTAKSSNHPNFSAKSKHDTSDCPRAQTSRVASGP